MGLPDRDKGQDGFPFVPLQEVVYLGLKICAYIQLAVRQDVRFRAEGVSLKGY